MEEQTFWYKVEFKEGASVFLETDFGCESFYQLVLSGHPIKILRRIVPIMQKQQLSFVLQEKLDPLMQFCKNDSVFLNTSSILYFTEIDVESDKWKQLSTAVLEEKNIATPNKKLILPG